MAKVSVYQTILKAKSHAKKGEMAKAQRLYKAVIQAFPKNKEALNGLATLNKSKRFTTTRNPPQNIIDQLIALVNQGQLVAAIKQATVLTDQYNQSFIIWNILGAANKGLNRVNEASKAFKKATTINPNYADGFNNLGVTLKDQGKLEEAIEACNKALTIMPDYAEAYLNKGVVLKAQGKLTAAIEVYNKALSLKPDYAEVYYNIGNALKDQGKLTVAMEAYKKALSFKPNYAEAFNNMGVIFQDQGKPTEAIDVYHKALALKSNYAEAFNNIGNALRNLGRLTEAVQAYNKALALKPNYAEAFNNMGNALRNLGRLTEAIQAYDKALSLKPDYDIARMQKLHQQQHICDWSSNQEDIKLISNLETSDQFVSPFMMLSLEDAPKRHRIRSEVFAKFNYLQKPLPSLAQPSKRPKRIRIGYFSADFHNHATMYLMAGVFLAHDRRKFKVYAYSYGPDNNDQMRQTLINSVDVFNEVSKTGDKDIALLARKDKIDIAIDLKGYTTGQRLGIFSYRPAPIQLSYLGYPGTTGTNFMDYIVADPVIVPINERDSYSEEIIYLPNTYQPNDNTRVISLKDTTKEDMGLPVDGFVFCCFNNNYKISSVEFDIWMSLLSKVKGSVLWLLKSNQWVEENLKQEAEKRDIKKDRLVFADKLPLDEHLARHKHADLFIDTFNVNAHTTASDALWTGLPVVTKLGQGFSARVAGSLLNAVGLPELITKNEEAYLALILELSTKPSKLVKIKEKLKANRLIKPLFDTKQYTKHLENGYQEVYQNYFEGKKPKTITVPL